MVEHMRGHGRCGGLAVRACETQRAAAAGDHAQSLGAFHHVEPAFAEIAHQGRIGRHSRSVDHQCALFAAELLRDGRGGIVVVAHRHAFIGEAPGEVGGSAVIGGHIFSLR